MIIPSIDIRGGEAVQLVGGRDLAISAGNPASWLERFAIAGEVAIVDLDAALGEGDQREIIAALCARAACRVGGGIRTIERARYWLDAGAGRIVLGTAAEPALLSQLPRERTIAALDAIDGEVVVDGWRTHTGRTVIDRIRELKDHVGGFLVTFVEREGRLGGIDADAIGPLVDAASDTRLTIAGGVTSPDDIALLDRLGADAQVGMALYSGRLSLADAVAAPLRTDRADGLFATVVVDELGVALGLAWSSRESLRLAVEQRRGIYHSRTQGIRIKGETSGAVQELLRIDLDCDRDAMRFTVRQAPPGFCHEGTATCWGPATGLGLLQHTVRDRQATVVDGSYTQRLLTDPALLASKLTEEAGELAAATTRGNVISEAADLLYFAMVRLQSAGVALADVDAELTRRARKVTRRAGDAKPEGTPTIDRFNGLRRYTAATVPPRRRCAVDPDTLARARVIVDAVRHNGDRALLDYAREFDGWTDDRPLRIEADALAAALRTLDGDVRDLLLRTAERINAFARAQRETITELSVPVPGGRAGHEIVAVHRVGCYAPAGRFPLPSSLLMGVLTAKAAGVREVWVATPSPSPLMLAAAGIAGATGVVGAGGAHAIAALAYGTESVPPCDVVVGPGNRWVTAAKAHVAGDVAIDFLAGPSELVVVADRTADPEDVAADLLAQAEHDADAFPVLVATDPSVIDAVDRALRRQLASLTPTTAAHQALNNGYAVLCADDDEVVQVIDTLAPEHLQLSVAVPDAVARRVSHAGAIFLGRGSAEVFGDYGAGPNHILPTGGAARHTGGLSVFNFLRVRTWLDIVSPQDIVADTAEFARLEGLEAHARAAERRM